MNVTVALTGALPAVVIVSAILTALTSVYLLWLYQRAVARAMRMQAGVAVSRVKRVIKPSCAGIDKLPTLVLIDSTFQPREGSPGGEIYRQTMQSLNRTASIYAMGGLAYAIVLTAAWMIAAKGGFILIRFLWLLSCYSWPILLSVSLKNSTIKKRTAIVYCTIILLVAGIGMVRNPDLTAGQLVYFWLFANGPGTLLLLAFLNRRVRAVGPLVLAFMIAAVTGAVIIVNIVGSSEGLMRGIVKAGSILGLGAATNFILLHLIGFMFFGLLGWLLLRWLSRRYLKKQMSDQSITLDAIWLLFGVVQSFTLVFEDPGWIFTGIAAFAAYKLVVALGFKLLARWQSEDTLERTLLLLRVFSLGQRSQRMFDLLSNLWLRVGSISLISGPDLVTTTVEPHEFLDFLGGRLSRQFIQGEKDLEQRVSTMDGKPDPDGRYRVNDFFCRADTWQMTMQRLAQGSDAVLMDLRSFSKSNQGCIYELRHLFNNVALDRVTLVIDDTTDWTFLEIIVKEIWQDMEPSSPNSELTQPIIRCNSIKQQSTSEIKQLLLMLFGDQPVFT